MLFAKEVYILKGQDKSRDFKLVWISAMLIMSKSPFLTEVWWILRRAGYWQIPHATFLFFYISEFHLIHDDAIFKGKYCPLSGVLGPFYI